MVSNKFVDDVDEELLKKYTNQAHDVGRIAIEYTDKRTVLNQLELSEGNNLINAGKVLFADDLIQDIQMAIFATNERLTFNDIQRHHGPVLKLVDIAENYIKSNIHPGSFPEGFEPQDFIDRPERPIRRNPKIARILYYSKDIESFGTGLKRIADACEKARVRYEFKKLKSGFVVCFYRSGKSEDKSTDKTVKSTDKVRINTDKLNFSQKKVIEFILDNGKVTNKDVQQLLGVKDSRALKILKELVQKDVVVKQGKLKGSYYTIKKYE